MRTSEDLYQRIRWDVRLDPARFVLGIEARRREPARVPFTSFVPGGDIPWHRVLYFEADGQIVWDRRTQLDRLDATDVGRARDKRYLDLPFFEPRHAVRWDGAEWSPAVDAPHPFRADARPDARSIRVATFNVLWDRYDEGFIETERRRPLIVGALRALDADLIALQEVELPLLDALLDAGWVRARYSVTAGPRADDVDRYGLVILSRLTVREVGLHALGPHKACVAVTADTADGPMVFAATHLTSDHTKEGHVHRARELAELRAGFAGRAERCAWLGDFNDGDPGLAASVDLVDAWTAARGADDQTPTFDPTTNALADISNPDAPPRRLDRVLVSEGVRVLDARVAFDDAATDDGLFLSDHYAVVVDLA